MNTNLSENQKKMLLRFYSGDEPSITIEGLFWLETPDEKINKRTLSSLIKRGLISVTGTGVKTGLLVQWFALTDHGQEIAEEIDEAAYQKRHARRGW